MKPAYVKVHYGEREYEFLGMECPECGSRWITKEELATGLKKIASDTRAQESSVGEEFHVTVD